MAIQQHSPLELEPWNDLNGKVVMVTGASAGLGREFCLDLASAGCKIIAAARRTDRLHSLCNEINQVDYSVSSSIFGHAISPMAAVESRRAVAVELDVCANGKSIEESVRKAWDSFGFIDTLINNAGLRGSVKSPLELSEEEWDHTMRTNLRGQWLVSKHICILMHKASRGGSIINISSISGLNRAVQTGALAYITSKAALNTLTKVMARELGAHKIRVNCICPGLFKSEITKDLMEKDWIKNVTRRTIPLKTHGTSDPALTRTVRYLIHDSSKYVTGNIFIADAGNSLPGVPIFSSL
ncbi:3-oxoacyl-[acyl-carrier-protein] reductase FabG-like [Benincasa hispida]|uniref:3-oxoacyl-[acyl-carrier-protein] reductase FabG-like n=1 Tax=Benincasa hispida TaxID=102211 RepID=UPI0018FF2C9D|nr:3-oxoacyl-[acyl-carrier-protein] reductase FabG-like [Benincasa hispida]